MTMPTVPHIHSSQHSGSRWWGRILLLLLVLIIGWYATVAVGVYSGRWRGAKTQVMLSATPLPIATVDWRPLSYRTFLNQRQAVTKYTTYLASTTSGVYQTQSDSEVSATTLTKMIRLSATEQLVRKLKVTVTSSDVNQAYTSQLVQNGDASQVAATIKELYGWTPEQFKASVIRPAILRDKLQEKLSFDETISGAAKTQADQVLAILNEGKESFSDVAKKYSDDVYGSNGGDLGFVEQGEQTKEIDDLAFTLDINRTSDVIHTKFGYHIIKPTERKTVDGVEQVHLYQITILAPQVDDYLNAQMKTMSIHVWSPGLQWDAENARVVAT